MCCTIRGLSDGPMTRPGETDRVWSFATITFYTCSEYVDEDRLRNKLIQIEMCRQIKIRLVGVLLSNSDRRMDMTRLLKTAEGNYSQPTALTVTTLCHSLYNKLRGRSFMLASILMTAVTSYDFLWKEIYDMYLKLILGEKSWKSTGSSTHKRRFG